jgi:hypothetical protein
MIETAIQTPTKEIWSGQSVRADLVWHDMDGDPETPTEVSYRVFDYPAGTPIAAAVSVDDPASTMSIVIPPASLPQGASNKRKIQVVIEATFSNGQKMPAIGIVTVRNRPALA